MYPYRTLKMWRWQLLFWRVDSPELESFGDIRRVVFG
jgi:hypothetical protein